MGKPFIVAIPCGEWMIGTTKLSNYPVSISGHDFMADLISTPILSHGIILGNDWLNNHGAVIDYRVTSREGHRLLHGIGTGSGTNLEGTI